MVESFNCVIHFHSEYISVSAKSSSNSIRLYHGCYLHFPPLLIRRSIEALANEDQPQVILPKIRCNCKYLPELKPKVAFKGKTTSNFNGVDQSLNCIFVKVALKRKLFTFPT